MSIKAKLLLITSVFTVTGCTLNFHKAKFLRSPNKIENHNINRSEEFYSLVQSIRDFGADFSSAYNLTKTDINKNNVISPFSLYSALAVAAASSNGNTQEELLNALHTNINSLDNEYANIYKASNVERSISESSKYYKKEILTNSIWLDKNLNFKTEMLDKLASKYFCYSISADFKYKNALTNKQMEEFVKEKTNGLIKPDFNFNEDTFFTILNTLYLKSLWSEYSYDVDMTDERYDFINRDGSIKNQRLYQRGYITGKILKEEKYSSFFAATAAGDRLKFIVPNDGYSLDEVINANSIKEVSDAEYEGIDDENKIIYKTRTMFPGFKAEEKIDAIDILKGLGVNDLFTDKCDFSPLLDDSVFCNSVEHVAKIEVTKKGIEAAAYTAMQMCGSAGPFDEYEIVYDDFLVNKAFYFVVSDTNNIPLFSGVCNSI